MDRGVGQLAVGHSPSFPLPPFAPAAFLSLAPPFPLSSFLGGIFDKNNSICFGKPADYWTMSIDCKKLGFPETQTRSKLVLLCRGSTVRMPTNQNASLSHIIIFIRSWIQFAFSIKFSWNRLKIISAAEELYCEALVWKDLTGQIPWKARPEEESLPEPWLITT